MRRALTVVVALVLGGTLGVLALRSWTPPFIALAQRGTELQGEDQRCLACHQNPTLQITFPSGEVASAFVDPERYTQAVHAGKLNCLNCHPTLGSSPHRALQAPTRRDYVLSYYQACSQCHFTNYTKTLDSVHYEILSQGHKNAPTCTDCHGSHEITPPNQPRSRIAQTCATCHGGIYQKYAQSVHGGALLGEDNPDVPVCTTCHGVHNIQMPDGPAFEYASVEICAQCHSDPKLMAKYGISTNVLKSYVEDFHGKTVALLAKEGGQVWPKTPTCVDCHGVHDIASVNDPSSPVIKANLLKTCQGCHPEASANFPSAWLSHYEPSPTRAPLVFAVRVFYWVLIPTMVGGLLLHVGLDVWRLARNR